MRLNAGLGVILQRQQERQRVGLTPFLALEREVRRRVRNPVEGRQQLRRQLAALGRCATIPLEAFLQARQKSLPAVRANRDFRQRGNLRQIRGIQVRGRSRNHGIEIIGQEKAAPGRKLALPARPGPGRHARGGTR